MEIILIKIWLIVLLVLDLLLIVQALSRIVLFFCGRSAQVNWTGYNRFVFLLLSVAFFPVTLAYLYLRR